jgi:hypothetical protein
MTPDFARSALDCGGASHRFCARDFKAEGMFDGVPQKIPVSGSCAFVKAAAGAAALQSASRETMTLAERRTETPNDFARSALDCRGASRRFLARDSKRLTRGAP